MDELGGQTFFGASVQVVRWTNLLLPRVRVRQNDGLERKTTFERPGFKAWHSAGSTKGDIVYEGEVFCASLQNCN